ncbi:MAG: hypothetical protein H6Q60_101 [Oscillospiraceae bacterium]|nr:hypothetical protein [Oscillospiraceae bacterium]
MKTGGECSPAVFKIIFVFLMNRRTGLRRNNEARCFFSFHCRKPICYDFTAQLPVAPAVRYALIKPSKSPSITPPILLVS